jgi:hypothetical protein
MLWFYERDQCSLTLETRYDVVTARFVVHVRWPDGREQTERFTSPEALGAWLVAFGGLLEIERWRPSNTVVLPYGWPRNQLT